jgi:hypothetical protein
MNEPRSPHGPYDTFTQVMADAAPLTAALAAADPHLGPMTDAIRAACRQARVDYIVAALADAGVELGDYDARIVSWLAGWETQTIQVIVGWIERAHAAAAPAAPTCACGCRPDAPCGCVTSYCPCNPCPVCDADGGE